MYEYFYMYFGINMLSISPKLLKYINKDFLTYFKRFVKTLLIFYHNNLCD